MRKCSFCGLPGHNIQTCEAANDTKTPWAKEPEDREHTMILDGGTEVSCTCIYWDAGESHYDFDGM